VRSARNCSETLLLDNGDVNKGYGRQSELKYETAMKAMAEMGYAASNVGEQDLVLGLDYVKYVADFTKAPLVSANIIDAADGQPVFQQFIQQQMRAGDRIASVSVIGIISPEFKDKVEEVNPNLSIAEYDSTLEQLIGQLRKKSDLLILLAHMSEEEASALASRYPQFDLIIAAHSGDDPILAPVRSGDVPIVFEGVHGMHIGKATFAVGAGRPRLQSYSPEKLDGTFADSPRMLALLDDYQQMLKAENLLEAYPRSEHGDAKFTGDKSCKRCHSLSSIRYGMEKHAHAFDSIVKKKHEYDPECVRCHTVAFGYVGGFVTPDRTPDMKNVGCEDCHGPGSKHVEKPLESKYDKVKKEACEACHNPENSPKFKYEEYVKKINHNSVFPCSAKVCHWFK